MSSTAFLLHSRVGSWRGSGLLAGTASLLSCQATDSALICRMRSVLGLLEVLAAALALLLLLAIVAAVRAFRRKGRRVKPEDIATDAR